MADRRRAARKSHSPRLRIRPAPRPSRCVSPHAQPLLRRADASERRPHPCAYRRRYEIVNAWKKQHARSDRGAVFSVVVATPDVVGKRMAGPGIRAWHLADELAKHFPTTLIAQLEDAQTRVSVPHVAQTLLSVRS